MQRKLLCVPYRFALKTAFRQGANKHKPPNRDSMLKTAKMLDKLALTGDKLGVDASKCILLKELLRKNHRYYVRI